MRILWHSNGPEDLTGYGRQTATWAPLLRGLGHQVAISAFHGAASGVGSWNRVPVYPGGTDAWGMDVVAAHYERWQADLLITLMDVWAADPAGMAGLNAACWVPVDCRPLAAGDRDHLRASGAVPVAMSRFGQAELAAAGFRDPLYVPHAVDTTVFAPPNPGARRELRRRMGVSRRFVIGICAANNDKSRKGFPEQFRAFAAFASRHPEAVLLVHARADNRMAGGLDLYGLAAHAGITGKVIFADEYDIAAGLAADADMAAWYGALDLLSACAWGEGFGLPIIEAQACGTPAVVTRASSMTELAGPGWLVDGDPVWVDRHEADWVKPSIGHITRAYEQAHKSAGKLRERAREHALAYDARRVLTEHWAPALAALATRCPPPGQPARRGSPAG